MLALSNAGGTKAFFPNIGANKHHRQRKFVRRSTKRSEVQSTCKMSRGWMMRRELRCEGLVGRARRAMARSIEGTRSFYGFKLLVLYAGSSSCICILLKSTGSLSDHDSTL